MANAKVINGTIVPDPSTVMDGVTQLLQQLRTDPQRAAAFRTNPRAVLGAHGYNEDIQNEVIAGDASLEVIGGCRSTCTNSCLITDCMLTSCTITI
jgi:hypothetical protein